MNPGTKTLGGPAEVALNGIAIPPQLLSEITVELTEGTRERETLAGTFSKPSGTLDTAQAMFTMFLPSMDYLKYLFPERYNAPSAPQTSGNVIFNTENCATLDPSPMNIHYTCEDNDANDVFFPAALVQLNFNPTYNNDDDLTIEVTVFAQPDEDGVVYRLGTGNLTEESIYDPETETTVPVGS